MHSTVPPEDALISPRSADSVNSDHTGAVASSTFLEQTYPPRCWLCRGRQYLRDAQRCWSHHDLKGSGESTQRVLDDLRAQARQVDGLCTPLSTTSFNVYVARGDEPHQLAAPLGVPSRLGTTSDAPHWLPGHLLLSARPLVY